MGLHHSKRVGWYWHEDTKDDNAVATAIASCLPPVTVSNAQCLDRAGTNCSHECHRPKGHAGLHVDGGTFGVEAMWGQKKLTKRELRAILVAVRLGVKFSD